MFLNHTTILKSAQFDLLDVDIQQVHTDRSGHRLFSHNHRDVRTSYSFVQVDHTYMDNVQASIDKLLRGPREIKQIMKTH